jgi:hypothetical protein
MRWEYRWNIFWSLQIFSCWRSTNHNPFPCELANQLFRPPGGRIPQRFDNIFIRPTFRPFRRPANFRAGETLVCFQAIFLCSLLVEMTRRNRTYTSPPQENIGGDPAITNKISRLCWPETVSVSRGEVNENIFSRVPVNKCFINQVSKKKARKHT